MSIDEDKENLGEQIHNFRQNVIFRLVVFLLLISGNLAACQTAATQPIEPSLSVKMGSDSESTAGLIQLQDPLDEPEFYCVDIPGAGVNLNLQGALQAHTCKLIAAEDETFLFNYPSVGQIYMEYYDLCLEAEIAAVGAELHLQECADHSRQQFLYKDGQIRLGDSGAGTLCLAVAPGTGTPTGGPSHLRRDLEFQLCASVEAALSEWDIP